MRYALSAAGLRCVREHLRGRPLLAFDIDGTLAPIVERPWDAKLPAALQEGLAALAGRATVALITGRAVVDALQMVAFRPRYLIGNHGADGVPGFEGAKAGFARTCRAWLDQLSATAQSWRKLQGVALEDKTYTLAFHYRQARSRTRTRRLLEHTAAQLAPHPTVTHGKHVLNMIPPGAPDKGDALRSLLKHSSCDRALYVGDDASDEAVFRLHLPAVLTLRVERASGSAADLYLRQQAEMARLVRELTHICRDALGADERQRQGVEA
jgi:trehalose 6-phosphate phosphatase